MTRKVLHSVFRAAASKALQARLEIGANPDKPLNPFLACEALGAEVRFVDVPSLEGMYHKGTVATVLVSSLRPSGRKTSTCGHELGHHVLGHGTRIDEIRSEGTTYRIDDLNEYAADVFSSFFLLPPALIRRLVSIGFVDNINPSPRQMYRLSTCLDVSYGGLLTHLSENLKVISRAAAHVLAKAKLPSIRQDIVGKAIAGPRALEVDAATPFTTLFAETGDLMRLSGLGSEDLCKFCSAEQPSEGIWRFMRAGSLHLSAASKKLIIVVNIRRSDFTGRARFQYLEDPDDHEGQIIGSR